MDRAISRRDFFDGIAVTAAGCAAGGYASTGIPSLAEPPFRLLGDTAQALAVPHALRDGRFWRYAGPPAHTGETYDLVVAGGGVSGLSAAHEWLRGHPGSRVLVLDNRDEVGGPGPESSGEIRSPSPETEDLLDRLGFPPAPPHHQPAAYDGVMCDAETFGADRLVELGQDWIGGLPLGERARRELRTLHEDPPDWFPGLPAEDKQERLAGLTYSRFLLEICRVHPDVERFCRSLPSREWACDARAFGAIDAWGQGYPGFRGLGLDGGKPSRFNAAGVRRRWDERPARHAPGPALVRALTGRLIHDGELDRPGNRVRVRLSSPVVLARDEGPAAVVGYFDGHEVRTVTAGAVILACPHAFIPYLVPDLPADQRQALRAAVRLPVLEAVVRLRGPGPWRAGRTRWTGAYWCVSELGAPAADGSVTARLYAAPCRSELGPRAGAAAARWELLRTPFEQLERSVRDQLARLLGRAGSDLGVEAVTVHRWGHGVAAGYRRPWDAFHPGGPYPADTARRRFGRIAIAGSDAGAGTGPADSTDAAITAACRAVRELAAAR
ncbi:NAD(P)-binding protein [Nonomuraea sp. NN258]|nr:NAD(P)-binding protein [Nonomuraea antri]